MYSWGVGTQLGDLVGSKHKICTITIHEYVVASFGSQDAKPPGQSRLTFPGPKRLDQPAANRSLHLSRLSVFIFHDRTACEHSLSEY